MSAPPHAPRTRLVRSALAAALVLLTGAVVRSHPTSALGPIIAVSADEVAQPFPLDGVVNPSISGRGEVVTFHDIDQLRSNATAVLRTPGADPVGEGRGIGISRDGCVSAWGRIAPNGEFGSDLSIGWTDLCRGGEAELFRTNSGFDDEAPIAVSAFGEYALLELPGDVIGLRSAAVAPPAPPIPIPVLPDFPVFQQPSIPIYTGPGVVRVDLNTGEVVRMPFTNGITQHLGEFGLDLSDDGRIAVATVATTAGTLEVAVWDVATGAVSLVTNVGASGNSMYPSLSADGRFVGLASTRRLGGGEQGNGPWVSVLDRSTGRFTRVSGAGDAAYYSSLSADGTQVAYGVGNPCRPIVLSPGRLEGSCPTKRIDVAFSPVPGLTSGTATETVSTAPVGADTPFHGQPSLSASGRWVTWVSTQGNQLMNNQRPELTGRRAFLRSRDASISIDTADFGPVRAGTVVTGATTVRNTGRTSVTLDRLDVGGAAFAQIAGGTCSIGLTLPPAGTCTVGVRFAAPAAPGDAAGSVVAGETGHVPLLGTGTLRGTSTTDPVIVTPTTTTTTTLPPTRTPTTTTTTTTTLPGQIIIDPQPRDVDFGPVAVGIGSALQTITVSNLGNRPASLVTAMGGANPDDFFVPTNGCNGIVLEVGATCTVDVLMVALAGGPRSAVLSFNVPNVGGEDVTLRGQGRFSPRLLASPAAITERGQTTIVGQGFPTDQPVTVIVGDSGLAFTVQPDALGMFRIPLAAFPSLTLGSYVVRVDARPEVYELVQTLLVVQLPTFQPQGPGGPAFGDSILVTRGG